MLFENLVIINGDHDGDSFVAALDRATGKTVWKIPRENHTRSYVTPIVRELAGRTPYHIQMIGGEVYQNSLSTVGPVALAQIGELAIDVFFMGAGGVDTATGWTNSNHVEAVIKRAVIARSKNVYAICDSAKWGQQSFAPILPFEGVTRWIVDRGLPREGVDAAKAAGMTVTYADGP